MAVTTVLSDALQPMARRRRTRATWVKRVLQTRLAVPASLILLLVVVWALFANVLAPYDPSYQDYNSVLTVPSRAHLLGTDDLGRDVLSRIIFGSRISLSVGLVAVGLAVAIGVPLGLVAAYNRGWIDDVLMRVMDAVSSIPALILALSITVALRPGIQNVMIAIAVVYTPAFARLARGEALSVRERDYISAARLLGVGPIRLIGRHILPNVTAPILVLASLRVATAIVTEASLSFLGAGVPPPAASWGGMLKTSYQYTETAPWLAVMPGVAIVLTVIAINIIGDALRTALDPRMRGRG
jgi:peptide/nickel transport system permease protein